MILNYARKTDIQYVIENLRKADRQELGASVALEDQDKHADFLRQSMAAHTLYFDGKPAAVYGVMFSARGVGSVWMWTTDKFACDTAIKQVVLDSQQMIEDYFDSGGHRLQVLTMSTHDNSRRFLEMVGFEQEGVLRAYGAGGENFVMYSIIRRTDNAG